MGSLLVFVLRSTALQQTIWQLGIGSPVCYGSFTWHFRNIIMVFRVSRNEVFDSLRNFIQFGSVAMQNEPKIGNPQVYCEPKMGLLASSGPYHGLLGIARCITPECRSTGVQQNDYQGCLLQVLFLDGWMEASWPSCTWLASWKWISSLSGLLLKQSRSRREPRAFSFLIKMLPCGGK